MCLILIELSSWIYVEQLPMCICMIMCNLMFLKMIMFCSHNLSMIFLPWMEHRFSIFDWLHQTTMQPIYLITLLLWLQMLSLWYMNSTCLEWSRHSMEWEEFTMWSLLNSLSIIVYCFVQVLMITYQLSIHVLMLLFILLVWLFHFKCFMNGEGINECSNLIL